VCGSTPIRQTPIVPVVISPTCKTSKLATPSLLAKALSGRALIFALFGGQGIHEIYTLFDTYRPLVEPFLASIINGVLQPLASASQGTSAYEHGLNVISWLTGVVPPT
jgi:fatty acid synthase subunit alpha